MGIVIRQSIKGTIATYIGACIGFITTMFIRTKFVSAEDNGLISVILEIGFMFGLLAQLGTSSSAIRFFPYFKNKENNNNGFFFYLMALPFLGCVIFILAYLILKTPVTNFFIKESELIVSYYYWIIPLIVFSAYLFVFESYSIINMRITACKFNREIIIRILTLIVYLLYGYHLINRTGFVAATIATYGLAMLFLFFYLSRISSVSLRHDISFLNKPLRIDIFKYSSYLLIGALGGAAIPKLDLFMVSAGMGLEYAGIYTIVTYIVAVIDIPSRSIGSISSPIASEAMKSGDLKRANKLYQTVSLHQLLTGGFLFVLIWINIDNIFKIMPNGDTYSAGKWVFLFLGISRLVTLALSFGGALISFSKHYHWSLYFTFFISALGILTNYLLIPIWGITGAAIASLLSCLLSYLAQQWIVFKKVKCNPYTLDLFKLIMILLVMTGINSFLGEIDNPWLDGIFRTSIIALIGTALLYFFKISKDLNNIVLIIIKKIKK
ncbi:MAG: polysaccharide biosynthesis C-terminal domain-containing protein [Prevotellaceae bacterium]|jgi:O-antigen/teichoic acid export membrane protein|nr:polysaccharide biosynthesis C-terminal domain-containing protein [Prevotellaceae bacterium]